MKRIARGLFLVAALLCLPQTTRADATSSGSLDAILASAVSHDVVVGKLGQFAVAPVGVEPGRIPAKVFPLIRKLVEAADLLDEIFWEQVSQNGYDVYKTLLADQGDRAQGLAKLMAAHHGPWDRLAGNSPLVGIRMKPEGAALYPTDLSHGEFQDYLDAHPESMGDLLSPYTVVRRQGSQLVAIRYSVKYKQQLERAAALLKEAAAMAPWKPLKEFLTARSEAFLSDDYYSSELKWMDSSDSPLIVVAGPYEFYEDAFMGAKTTFEAILAWRDDAETERFAGLREEIPTVLAALPLTPDQRAAMIVGKMHPVTIADEIYAAGEARSAGQTLAFSLPNDPRVQGQKGLRQVVLRNVARAKFTYTAQPLSREVVAEDQNVEVTFGSYFDLFIATELARSIRPAKSVPDGQEKTKLRQRILVIEETFSDVVGLLTLMTLSEKGLMDKRSYASLGATFITQAFRVLRFDEEGVHGVAKALAFNFMARKKAFLYDPTTRRYRVDLDRLKPAAEALVRELAPILINKDVDKAAKLILDFGLLTPDMRDKLLEVKDVPVDILASFHLKDLIK